MCTTHDHVYGLQYVLSCWTEMPLKMVIWGLLYRSEWTEGMN